MKATKRILPAVVAVLLVTPTAVVSSEAPPLDVEARKRALLAIESVYHDRRTGSMDTPIQRVLTDDLLEQRVTTQALQSIALERYFDQTITDAMLRWELERIKSESRAPEVLAEIFAALGNDETLIRECLVRPILADRLLRARVAYSTDVQRSARSEIEELRQRLEPESFKEDVGKYYHSTTLALRSGDSPAPEGDLGPNVFPVTRHEMDRLVQSFRGARVGSVRETEEYFAVSRVAEHSDTRVVVENAVVPKVKFEEWWSTVEPELSAGLDAGALNTGSGPGTAGANLATVRNDQTREVAGSLAPDGAGVEPPDMWVPFGRPRARQHHTAVWTGTEMILWGGTDDWTFTFDIGMRYNPATDSWKRVAVLDAPEGRGLHTAVWTGSEMIVWGGSNGTTQLDTGGRYDPVTDTWMPTIATGAPSARIEHTAVWAAGEMIVFGGRSAGLAVADGGSYDPLSDSWTSLTPSGQDARRGHVAVWTGEYMVAWGGRNSSGPIATGTRYRPSDSTWTPVTATDAPSARFAGTAVWAPESSRMILWGGTNGTAYFNTGGRYDPTADSWTATTTTAAPPGAAWLPSVWTGSRMIVWGGEGTAGAYLDTGGRYNPSADSWAGISSTGAPSVRSRFPAVWTGSKMIVWGGHDGDPLDTGGLYSPSVNSWTPTGAAASPTGRVSHTSVWTGSEMIVWGGSDGLYLDTGSAYDPATDTWSATTTSNAPSSRIWHTALWTGTEMIVWGGYGATGHLGNGARYNPATDQWDSVTTADAPSERHGHTALWTGSEMLVWGGHGVGYPLRDGHRYDPAGDSWLAMSGSGAPSGRYRHTAIWADTNMIVWGGLSLFGELADGGGRFDPSTDSWTDVSAVGAPLPRYFHTAVWSGSEMIVWGGFNGSQGALDGGGRFDPVTDTWTVVPTLNAPSPRYHHTAVWSPDGMIVWGGDAGMPADTGGVYDPTTDAWTETTRDTAPEGRSGHGAVWADTAMIVWGGIGSSGLLDNGALFDPDRAEHFCDDVDSDGDGVVDDGCNPDGDPACRLGAEVAGPPYPAVCTLGPDDCDETNPDVYPGAPEIIDGVDNQCPGDPGYGEVDEEESALCDDSNFWYRGCPPRCSAVQQRSRSDERCLLRRP